MTDAVVPSWEGVRERRVSRLQRVDAKLVIAVLIGLVSVTDGQRGLKRQPDG